MRVRGRLTTGLGEAAQFTQLDWVLSQCQSKLGFIPYPGTVNLEVLPEDLPAWSEIKSKAGVVLDPPESSFCKADCYPLTINERLHGAALVPHVAGYPENKLEIIASVKVTSSLSLRVGDVVELTVVDLPD